MSFDKLTKGPNGATPQEGRTSPRVKVAGKGASNPVGAASGPITPDGGVTPRPSGDPMTLDVPARIQPSDKATRPTPRATTSTNPFK